MGQQRNSTPRRSKPCTATSSVTSLRAGQQGGRKSKTSLLYGEADSGYTAAAGRSWATCRLGQQGDAKCLAWHSMPDSSAPVRKRQMAGPARFSGHARQMTFGGALPRQPRAMAGGLNESPSWPGG